MQKNIENFKEYFISKKEQEFNSSSTRAAFENYLQCDCAICPFNCPHKDAYRRFPIADGGLGLCKRLDTTSIDEVVSDAFNEYFN